MGSIQYTYLRHPPVVALETYGYCNGNCVFCNFHTTSRKRGAMSDRLFHKIIDEISTWEKPPQVSVNFGGEFFMDSRWLDLLLYINKVSPASKIVMVTNGSTLDDTKINDLVKIQNFDIGFSLYAYYPDTYQRLMGLPFDTIDKISNAINRISKERPDVHISISCTADSWYISGQETKLLIEKWKGVAVPHPMVHNAQHIDYPLSFTPPSEPCQTMFNGIQILHNGDVCICCFDANGEVIFGNVNDQMIFDIWNGKLLTNCRTAHVLGMRHVIPLCGSCNYGYSALDRGFVMNSE